ncbi:MAG: hypothetical protein U1E47_00155 [Rivihabitans pingtungensis]
MDAGVVGPHDCRAEDRLKVVIHSPTCNPATRAAGWWSPTPG